MARRRGGASARRSAMPAETALGLAGFATAVAGFSGSTSIGAVADLSADVEFINWLGGLINTVPAAELSQPTPLATMLVRPSLLDAAAASDAEFIDASACPDGGVRDPVP